MFIDSYNTVLSCWPALRLSSHDDIIKYIQTETENVNKEWNDLQFFLSNVYFYDSW